jgi:hypothetical protein
MSGPASSSTGPRAKPSFLDTMLPKLFSQTLDAPASEIWRLITDTLAWPRWGPTVRAVECSERYIRAGSTGRLLTPIGLWLPFAVERFEPERFWDWRVGGVVATGHRVEPRGPRRCELTFSVPRWASPYGIICRAALKRIERLSAQAASVHSI